MASLLRGEIRWAEIEPASQVVGHEQGNPRPALILSNDRFNAGSQLVIVALIGSAASNRERFHSLQIESVQMPKHPSWVLVDQIRTLSAQRIGDYIGTMDSEEFETVLWRLFQLMDQRPT